MTPSKRDANERELIRLWRALGAMVIQMDRNAGFDLILVYRGVIYIVEVKDGSKSWSLTENEETRKNLFEIAGIPYNIITNEQEALTLIGAS